MTLYIYPNSNPWLTQFTNTYSTAIRQSATYDPNWVPEADPPRPIREPPPLPIVDPNFKERPLFTSANPPNTGYTWFFGTTRSSEKVYPASPLDYSSPSIVVRSADTPAGGGSTIDYDGGIKKCKLWHPDDPQSPIVPSHNYGSDLEYPSEPHPFWNEFRSVPWHGISLRAAIDALIDWYPKTQFITLRPTIQFAIGHAVWSCGNPDDGWYQHSHDDIPDSPQTIVNNWDWYSWTDYQPIALVGNFEAADDTDILEDPAFASPTKRVEIARPVQGVSYLEDQWYTEPESTLQRGTEWGADIDFNDLMARHYLLRPTAHTWVGQNPDNTANRIMWLPEEIDEMWWSARGAWGHVTIPTLACLVSGYQGSQGASQWMAVL